MDHCPWGARCHFGAKCKRGSSRDELKKVTKDLREAIVDRGDLLLELDDALERAISGLKVSGFDGFESWSLDDERPLIDFWGALVRERRKCFLKWKNSTIVADRCHRDI